MCLECPVATRLERLRLSILSSREVQESLWFPGSTMPGCRKLEMSVQTCRWVSRLEKCVHVVLLTQRGGVKCVVTRRLRSGRPTH